MNHSLPPLIIQNEDVTPLNVLLSNNTANDEDEDCAIDIFDPPATDCLGMCVVFNS